MESFEDIIGKAKDQVQVERRQESVNQKAEETEKRLANEAEQRVAELEPIVMNEAIVIAKAMRHAKQAKTYPAVSRDIMRSSINLMPSSGGMGNTTPAAWRRRRGEKRVQEVRQQNSFPVWDLDSRWSHTEENEPYDTERQHYFLASDGSVYYTEYFSKEQNDKTNDFVGVDKFNVGNEYEARLNIIRNGLAKLVVRHELEVSL